MTPAEVTRFLNVDRTTLIRWEKLGKIRSSRTPGGHRRYDPAEIRALRVARETAAPQEAR